MERRLLDLDSITKTKDTSWSRDLLNEYAFQIALKLDSLGAPLSKDQKLGRE